MAPVTVCTCGAFDPIHFGHVNHFREARKLGDRRVVILNSDADGVHKRNFVCKINIQLDFFIISWSIRRQKFNSVWKNFCNRLRIHNFKCISS